MRGTRTYGPSNGCRPTRQFLTHISRSTRPPSPISVEARRAEEASQRFDAISYTKGAAVLRMIEGYLGEDTFREGVRIYLRRHAEANASADDFWRALDEASGQDVTAIANAWIQEPGHPRVHIPATQTGGAPELELRQERYFSDSSAKPTGQV